MTSNEFYSSRINNASLQPRMLIKHLYLVFSAKELLAALKNECRPMLRESSKIIHLEPSDSPLRWALLLANGCSFSDH